MVPCLHCGRAIIFDRESQAPNSRLAWVHVSGDGGRIYCDYSPTSKRAEPR